MSVVLLDRIGRLFTATEAGVATDAALVVADDRIAWVGDTGVSPPATLAGRVEERVDCEGGLVTPGLVDAHTHPVYSGQRFAEIAARSAGLSYRDVGADGGIAATVAATRSASFDTLREDTRHRLADWAASGTTTVEVKTGYHLERDGELRTVDLLAGLRGQPGLPDLRITFLAAHALPPEADGDWDAYADTAAGWSTEAAARGADACDVFCDEGYFSVAQSERVLRAGARAGLQVRVHADELARTGGAQLAARLDATSADHLLRVTEKDAHALAAAGVAATLCPGTALAMGATPDVGALRSAGVTVALGSDHNPGMCGTTDMTVVLAMAVAGLGLSVEEALFAATAGGTAAVGLSDRGAVREGLRADLVWWDADHEGAFAWAWGVAPRRVWAAGVAHDPR
jgi:imidazolonepropionase